jgi:O-antigen ligase
MTQADWLPGSAPHRVFIWNHVSEWALEKPLAGWGFDSSSEFPNRGVEPWPNYGSVIPLHPHNAALQVFLELGALGLLIAAGVLLEAVRRTEAAGAAWAPWLGAAALTAYAIASSGYGIWQTQWVAALLWCGCFTCALRCAEIGSRGAA